MFQWGNLASLFGVTATGPILPFLPIMLFAILFGLSMDYQVFLVSRMQEEWTRTQDNKLSVRRGLIGSGRVVMAAAAIMFSVFISFVFGDDNTIKMFGLALAIAVALDAFVVRLVLVPSLMTVLGRANWYLPGWLSKILPSVHIESEEEAAEIVDPLADDEPEPAQRLVSGRARSRGAARRARPGRPRRRVRAAGSSGARRQATPHTPAPPRPPRRRAGTS